MFQTPGVCRCWPLSREVAPGQPDCGSHCVLFLPDRQVFTVSNPSFYKVFIAATAFVTISRVRIPAAPPFDFQWVTSLTGKSKTRLTPVPLRTNEVHGCMRPG